MELSTIVSQAGRLKPEVRVSQAVTAFEQALTDDRRGEWQVLSQARSPGPEDVIALTSDIGLASSIAHGQRMAPRLTKLLTGIQAFTSAIDLVIGGSQNLIASSVWAVVKTALKTASKHISFFDKLTHTIAETTQAFPDFVQLAGLYPRSPGLHEAFCDYVTNVVSLCTKIIRYLQGTKVRQLTRTVFTTFDAEFQDLLQGLSRNTQAIERKVKIASEESHQLERVLQAADREESSLVRQVQSSLSAGVQKELAFLRQCRKKQARTLYLNSFSTYDCRTAWRQARKRGNASWIFQNAEYLSWLQSEVRAEDSAQSTTEVSSDSLSVQSLDANSLEENRSVFCCSGALGSGKTVVAANVLERLLAEREQPLIAFHFCRSNQEVSLQANTIIRSLYRQLLERILAEDDDLDVHTDGVASSTLDLLVERGNLWLDKRRDTFSSIVVVLDGLDECNAHMLATLREHLLALPHDAKIFYTVRSSSLPRETGLLGMQASHHIEINRARGPDELQSFVIQELENCLETERLSVGDPELICKIHDTLVEKSQGMYLWIYFQINSICAQGTDHDIIQTLERLPKDLPETYDRLLLVMSEHLESVKLDKCKTMFEIIAVAKEPLTIDHMREILNIQPGVPRWNATTTINNMHDLVDHCKGLLICEEDDQSLQFPHFSIAAHLFPTTEALNRLETNLGVICVTYLSLSELDRRVARPHWELDSRKILDRSVSSINWKSNTANSRAISLLRKLRTGKSSSITLSTRNLSATTEQFAAHFKAYAELHWLDHTRSLDNSADASQDCTTAVEFTRSFIVDQAHELCGSRVVSAVNWAFEMRHRAYLRALALKKGWLFLHDSEFPARLEKYSADILRLPLALEWLQIIFQHRPDHEALWLKRQTLLLLFSAVDQAEMLGHRFPIDAWEVHYSAFGLPTQTPPSLQVASGSIEEKFTITGATRAIWEEVHKTAAHLGVQVPRLNDDSQWDLTTLKVLSDIPTDIETAKRLFNWPRPIDQIPVSQQRLRWGVHFWPFFSTEEELVDMPFTSLPYLWFRAIASRFEPEVAKPMLLALIDLEPGLLFDCYDGLTIHHWASAFGHDLVQDRLAQRARESNLGSFLYYNPANQLSPRMLRQIYEGLPTYGDGLSRGEHITNCVRADREGADNWMKDYTAPRPGAVDRGEMTAAASGMLHTTRVSYEWPQDTMTIMVNTEFVLMYATMDGHTLTEKITSIAV